jgi:hypothetical protein
MGKMPQRANAANPKRPETTAIGGAHEKRIE